MTPFRNFHPTSTSTGRFFSSKLQYPTKKYGRTVTSRGLDLDSRSGKNLSRYSSLVTLIQKRPFHWLSRFEEKIDIFWRRSLKMPFFVGKNTGIRRVAGVGLCNSIISHHGQDDNLDFSLDFQVKNRSNLSKMLVLRQFSSLSASNSIERATNLSIFSRRKSNVVSLTTKTSTNIRSLSMTYATTSNSNSGSISPIRVLRLSDSSAYCNFNRISVSSAKVSESCRHLSTSRPRLQMNEDIIDKLKNMEGDDFRDLYVQNPELWKKVEV